MLLTIIVAFLFGAVVGGTVILVVERENKGMINILQNKMNQLETALRK